MTLIQFLRLVARNLKYMLFTGILAAAMVFFSTKNGKKEYQSYAIINTGLVSGYNIESSQSSRVDYAYTNNEIENIMGLARSRETLEDLNVRLLAQVLLLGGPDPEIISPASWQELQEMIPAEVRAGCVAPGDLEATVSQLKKLRNQPGKNPVKEVLEGKNELFGIEHLQTIVVKRENNSDMIRIAYTTTDAAVCRNTIAQLIDLFIAKHRTIKEGQSTSVLAFFEKATSESAAILAGKEDDMLGFMVGNKIINYYEQTRFIAAKKEDLDELYFKEVMKLAAADSSRRNLEGQLGNRVNLPAINRDLMVQREQLAANAANLAILEIGSLTDSLPNPAVKPQLAALNQQADKIITSMRRNAEATFAANRTPEGLETQQLLRQWLEQWLDVEQTLARLGVLRDRKTEFDQIYSRFAPWGSKLKRLEREIDVAERAYLENLHSYNQARLHKHNMLMSTNLRVVDTAFLPDKPLPSKRAMLVIVAFLAGIILVLAGVIGAEYLDTTLREPVRACTITEMPTISAFPELPANWKTSDRLDYPDLMRRAAAQVIQRLQLDLKHIGRHEAPARIAILSTRTGDGKSTVLEVLNEQAARLNTRFQFLEFPALLRTSVPLEELQQTDGVLVIASAKHGWGTADARAVALVNEITGRTSRLLLNRVRPDDLECTLGEIPKKRSFLRRYLKRKASMNFNTL